MRTLTGETTFIPEQEETQIIPELKETKVIIEKEDRDFSTGMEDRATSAVMNIRQPYGYYTITAPDESKTDKYYESEIMEINDVGLTIRQTTRILNISKSKLKYLLQRGCLWKVPYLTEDGRIKRIHRIAIKSIIDYIRKLEEKQILKFAD